MFYNCRSLKSINIPDSVTSIGYEVFRGWTSSQTIYIKGRSEELREWESDWSVNCNAKIVWNA